MQNLFQRGILDISTSVLSMGTSMIPHYRGTPPFQKCSLKKGAPKIFAPEVTPELKSVTLS